VKLPQSVSISRLRSAFLMSQFLIPVSYRSQSVLCLHRAPASPLPAPPTTSSPSKGSNKQRSGVPPPLQPLPRSIHLFLRSSISNPRGTHDSGDADGAMYFSHFSLAELVGLSTRHAEESRREGFRPVHSGGLG
jgi:hypothetical protein